MRGVGVWLLPMAETGPVTASDPSRLAHDQIIEVHAGSGGTYGARRVQAELTLGRDIGVGREAVSLLMRRAGIEGLPGNRNRRRRPAGGPTALDLVDRNFARSEPDQLWVTDI